MPNPVTPPVHFDYFLGVHPELSKVILDDLATEEESLRTLLNKVPLHKSTVWMIISMLRYRKHGQNTYEIPAPMRQMLRHTSLRGIERDEIKFPYPAFYINLPECDWEIWGGERTQWHKVCGLYVFIEEDVLHFHLCALENDKSRVAGDDASFWLQIKLDVVFDKFDGDFDRYLDETFNHYEDGTEDALKGEPGDPSPDSKVFQAARSALYLLVNLMLYVTSVNAEMDDLKAARMAERAKLQKQYDEMEKRGLKGKRKKKARRLKKKLEAITEARVILVGKELSQKIRMSGKQATSSRRDPGRFEVPAHYNHYWVGSKMDDHGNPRKGEKRIRKWIKGWTVNAERSMAKRVEGRIYKLVDRSEG